MINEGKRELAYIVKIDGIEPIEGKDRVEAAVVGGWRVMVKKGEFNIGDSAVYFEIDSLVDKNNPAFAFLEQKKYRIKTQRYKAGDGVFYSQGLVMSLNDLGLIPEENPVGTPLTDKLKITYYVPEDNERKSSSGNPNERYNRMSARHQKLAKTKLWRWLMKRQWGKDLLFTFFGKTKDKNNRFPKHFPYIHVTDEERVENMPWILQDKSPWVKTQKIDGTSSTYILEKKKSLFGHKYEYYVCSRNVRQMDRNQKNYHNDIGAVEDNVYWAMNDKYHIYDFLKSYLEDNNLDYVALQGEIAGVGIQANPHKLPDVQFFGFNFIRSDVGRLGTVDMKFLLDLNNIPSVPIADSYYILPDDMEEFKLSADGECEVGNGLREGYVYRSLDGQRSFKNVSREYLAKKGK